MFITTKKIETKTQINFFFLIEKFSHCFFLTFWCYAVWGQRKVILFCSMMSCLVLKVMWNIFISNNTAQYFFIDVKNCVIRPFLAFNGSVKPKIQVNLKGITKIRVFFVNVVKSCLKTVFTNNFFRGFYTFLNSYFNNYLITKNW